MARLKLRFHPEAAREAERARDWYERRSYIAADAFALELEAALDDIAEFPEAWPPYRDRHRRRVLPRFPFSIVYRMVGVLWRSWALFTTRSVQATGRRADLSQANEQLHQTVRYASRW